MIRVGATGTKQQQQTNYLPKAAGFPTCNQDVPASNLDRSTDYPEA
jgi:hypothetical protein